VEPQTAIALPDATCVAVEGVGLEDLTAMHERLTALLDDRGVKARDGFRVLYIAILGRPREARVRRHGLEVPMSPYRLRAAQARLEL
jgi:hypothetical protein